MRPRRQPGIIRDPACWRLCRYRHKRHTYASLLLQQGESIVYVKEQLGHASIQITVDTYGHLIPGANRAAVDRLDDAPMQPNATQAQPEPFDEDPTLQEMQELLGESGEPPRNRTENPQIKRTIVGTRVITRNTQDPPQPTVMALHVT
jgi:hypothetical protein